jgi:hypothetical protein
MRAPVRGLRLIPALEALIQVNGVDFWYLVGVRLGAVIGPGTRGEPATPAVWSAGFRLTPQKTIGAETRTDKRRLPNWLEWRARRSTAKVRHSPGTP